MSNVIVATRAGGIRGRREGGVSAFLQIPFAKAMDGFRRFRPPEPCESWFGIRDCLEFGPQAPQLAAGDGSGNEEFISEDCLTLNVWTPATDDRRRPVLVWIHGGSLIVYGARDPDTHGAALAERQDVVVVTIQYRMGVFGFLHLAEVGGPGYEQSGNHGFLDQVAALEWIRDNIAAFGGDPGNVTIFGQSSGADSVSTLMCMPQARGLFHRAIMQSGCPVLCVQPEHATEVARHMMDIAGASTVEDLQAMSMEELLDVQSRLLQGYPEDFVFVPVVDGISMSETTLETFAHGNQARVPLMLGSTLDEMRLYPALYGIPVQDITIGALRSLWRDLFDDAAWRAIEEAYFDGRTGEDRQDALFRLVGDIILRMPMLRIADSMAPEQPTFVYLFSYRSNVEGFKAAHSIEVPFVFGTLEGPHAIGWVGDDPHRLPLGEQTQCSWAEFARTGDPNHEGLPTWPSYQLPHRPTMVFDVRSEVEDDPLSEERRAWETVPFDGYSPTIEEIDTLGLVPGQ
jgi:para-nitrobenzyl esterase